MDEDEFSRPRHSAQTALALITASAHGDHESRYRILEELRPDDATAVLVSMCALVVGGWPVDAEMGLSRWLGELGKRVAGMVENLPPLP
jgi:hypothetical protein